MSYCKHFALISHVFWRNKTTDFWPVFCISAKRKNGRFSVISARTSSVVKDKNTDRITETLLVCNIFGILMTQALWANVTNMTIVTPWDPVGQPLDRGQQINEHKSKSLKGKRRWLNPIQYPVLKANFKGPQGSNVPRAPWSNFFGWPRVSRQASLTVVQN